MAQWAFNRNGKAKIIFDESCFRDARGRVVGWINNTNVFNLRGRHIGWYEHGVVSVSYTHLTLPTILLV